MGILEQYKKALEAEKEEQNLDFPTDSHLDEKDREAYEAALKKMRSADFSKEEIEEAINNSRKNMDALGEVHTGVQSEGVMKISRPEKITDERLIERGLLVSSQISDKITNEVMAISNDFHLTQPEIYALTLNATQGIYTIFMQKMLDAVKLADSSLIFSQKCINRYVASNITPIMDTIDIEVLTKANDIKRYRNKNLFVWLYVTPSEVSTYDQYQSAQTRIIHTTFLPLHEAIDKLNAKYSETSKENDS